MGLRLDCEEVKDNRELEGAEEDDDWGWMDKEDIVERGYNALDKRRLIKQGLDQLRPDVVFLQETKMDNGEEKSLLGSWKQWSGVFVDSEGASGGLGILWNANIHKVEEGLASNMWQFGNIFAIKRDLENRLASLQEDIIQMGMTSKKFLQERELKGQYSEVLAREEVFWRQKLRECWLKEGDRNTKFFHNSVKAKRSRNKITTILNRENVVLDKVDDINKEAVEFFLTLLSKDNDPKLEKQQEGLNVIPELITDAQNQSLMKPIQFEEVRKAVFSMEGDKAPGPDGFSTFFFQTFWEVVGFEVWEVVEESQNRVSVAKEFNCTLIALIPKVEHPVSFSEFRPISLCNTIYKIISKVMANRLKPLLSLIILEEQSGFVPGRSIMEGIIIAHEAIHTVRQVKVNGMMIKLDIRKAYDMVDREFLIQQRRGRWKGIKIAEGMDPVTHQQFADDTLLCGQSSLQEARVMRKTLDIFCKASGQQVNWSKSEAIFFNTEIGRQQAISNILGVRMGTLRGKFLGTPLFGGRNNLSLWKNLIEACANRLEGWKSKWISLSGRILLLKAVLSALPIFSMIALRIPEKVINFINRGMRKFLWNGKEANDKIPLVAWDKVCQDK
ncbi:uncharacterized protein LOC131857643 [Cryptomeria japonica]|uniref:uncharacterized protein LOC131857643 n=1 Tax=Cryptomeria japonica TaxID=3369 RepID=UPI0027DA5AB4|nr:uncharacterized protein LOC131857643 [Cryptomeria japonica]